MRWFRSLVASFDYIDFRIAKAVGSAIKGQLMVHSLELPAYRFADLSHAVEACVAGRANVDRVETEQNEPLNQLIHNAPTQWTDRSVRKATKVAWQTGPKQETYFPVDCFWICPSTLPAECCVIRLSFNEYMQKSKLEVASGTTEAAKNLLDRIIDHSRVHSIYRNHTLQLAYEAGTKDDYGDVEKAERFQVAFSTVDPVTDTDIVLAEDHISVLRRNVVDLYRRRDILEANGVPSRRGILLHGPPGTGKTFVCRYLCHKLDGVTRIFVTGSSLLQVGAIFSFARLLQPSVLFLEDVDLIFASREINLYSTALGDLLDQMDGLRAHENISVILTTNAIDRLEAAIKDRPGRISQCIYMGAPAPKQRLAFISHQLQAHNATEVDIDMLVETSEGATQAFLKEWIQRAVQIACERLDSNHQRAELINADFTAAMTEMRRFLEGSDGRIIGFVSR